MPDPVLNNLPLPTKDEMALVNGVPLTIRGYLDIRASAPRLSPERSLWAGIAALALHAESKQRGRPIDKVHALNIARYAIEDLPPHEVVSELTHYYREGLSHLPPSRIRQDIDALLARSVVIKTRLNLSRVF
jgi:hypothetical protein